MTSSRASLPLVDSRSIVSGQSQVRKKSRGLVFWPAYNLSRAVGSLKILLNLAADVFALIRLLMVYLKSKLSAAR